MRVNNLPKNTLFLQHLKRRVLTKAYGSHGPVSATADRQSRKALPDKKNGPVAEWLGKALQKLLHRFESGRDL